VRLFVAVWPPADVLDALAALPRVSREGVRWTTRDQWHATLRFLGNVDDDGVGELSSALAHAVGSVPRTEAVMGPAVEALGRAVVCVPIAGLDGVAAAAIEGTASFGQPPEARPFKGHLTLARVRRGSPRALCGAPISERWPVDEVHLVRSNLHPKGARYETVSVARLA
jgi:RNA 2',3'-cyclic 3'-phosphodiesterase